MEWICVEMHDGKLIVRPSLCGGLSCGHCSCAIWWENVPGIDAARFEGPTHFSPVTDGTLWDSRSPCI